MAKPGQKPAQLAIDAIEIDDTVHPRAAVDQSVVVEYTDLLRGGVVFPPIDVFFDGARHHLADGRHRLEATRQCGERTIHATVHQGDKRQSVLFAVAANNTHGVRRTNADKRKTVKILLADKEWRTWSANQIAKQCNVSWGTVQSVWEECQAELHLQKFEDVGDRKVQRGNQVFTQKLKSRNHPAKAHAHPAVSAIQEMLEQARKARTGFTDSTLPAIQPKLERIERDLQEILGTATGADFRMAKGLNLPLNVYVRPRAGGIQATPEFAKKKLCNYSVAVGMACGHQCTYCSSPSLRYQHAVYGEIHISSHQRGYAVVDKGTPERIRKSMPRLKDSDVIQISTLDDAWSPEARRYGIGRECLEILLKETPAQIRILTKSADVATDFDIIKGFEKRVIVGLSTGIPASREDAAAVIETNASPVKDRLKALRKAHDLGIRTYGMLCPCLPGIADTDAALAEMFDAVIACGVEDIWLEPVNRRGRALHHTSEALRLAGMASEAAAADSIRKREAWSTYARSLIEKAIGIADRKKALGKLHILLYPRDLSPPDTELLRRLNRGIVWLEEKKPAGDL